MSDLVIMEKAAKAAPFSLSIFLLPIVIATATLIEVWFIWQIREQQSLVLPAVGFHCLAALLCKLMLRNARSPAFALFDFSIFLFALLGPLGGLIGSAFMQFEKRKPDAHLADWHKTLTLDEPPTSQQEDIFSKIMSNRSLDMTNGSLKPFQKIFSSDNTQEIKRALSIITLKYKPELLEFLQAALKNDKPEIRVQAAAVYTKLKQRFQDDISNSVIFPEDTTSEHRREAISRLKAAGLSQLIDTSQRDQVTATLRKLLKTDVRPEAERALTVLRADRLIQKGALKEAQLCLKPLVRIKDPEATALNQRISDKLNKRAVLPAREHALIN
ncbi:hypothetical protein ACMG4P_14510 [Pseudovibrio denitrificans]|uniref:hypothetical protein n=1 Tax=Pseudovibrio denitrificans TaxID=258256 RepID=UPI0039BFC38F